MSKRKRAEKLIGKKINLNTPFDFLVLGVEIHSSCAGATPHLCLKLLNASGDAWYIKVNSRVKYNVRPGMPPLGKDL